MSFQVARNTALPVGAITQYALAAAPIGWLLCDGGQYAVALYPLLDALLGVTYGARTDGVGGAGSSHFRVPDARGRVAVGAGTGAGEGAAGTGTVPAGTALTARAVGYWAGSERHTLTTGESGNAVQAAGTSGGQSATHTHTVAGTAVVNLAAGGGATTVPSVSTQSDAASVDHTHTTPGVTGVGASASHENTQPIIVVSYIIKAT